MPDFPESPLILTLIFFGCAAIIVVAGVRLARHGDAIGERTGLGGLWMGSIFLAAATSLPELATDIAAVRIGAIDLAAGDLFGSSMSNMLILAIIDLLPPRSQVLRAATLDHAISAMLAIVLTAIAAVFLLLRSNVSWLGVGPGSAALAVTYFIGTRAIWAHNEAARAGPPAGGAVKAGMDRPVAERPHAEPEPLRRAIIGFVGAAFVILVVAPIFAKSGEGIAEASGLGTTFVGTWLVGFSTSLPELVASLAAVRMRAFDLAVGNLFGSNALNMIMFVVLDLVSPSGPILASVSQAHAISALAAIMLMATGMAGIAYRAHGRLRMAEPSSVVMVLIYVMGLVMLYQRSVS